MDSIFQYVIRDRDSSHQPLEKYYFLRSDNFLQFRIFDRPGIIGKVATILGSHNINISGFHLSRQQTGEEVAFVSVDDTIGVKVLKEILTIDGMIEAKEIQL